MEYALIQSWERLAAALLGPVAVCPGADCGLVECEPEWSWNPHPADFDLWLVLSGHGVGVCDGRRFDLTPGVMVILRPGDEGRFDHAPDDPLTVVYCHFDLLERDSTRPRRLSEDLLPSRVLSVSTVQADRLRTVIRLATDPHPAVAVERASLLTLLLLDLYRTDAARHGMVTR